MHIASERNQHIKAIYYIIPTIDHSRKGNHGNGKNISCCQGWGEELGGQIDEI